MIHARICILVGVLIVSLLEASAFKTPFRSARVATRQFSMNSADESPFRGVARKGAAILVAVGLGAPRVANARMFGAKKVEEKTGGSDSYYSTLKTNSKPQSSAKGGKKLAKVEVVVTDDEYDEGYEDEYEDEDYHDEEEEVAALSTLDADDELKNIQYRNIGLGVAALATLAAVFTGDGDDSSKKRRKGGASKVTRQAPPRRQPLEDGWSERKGKGGITNPRPSGNLGPMSSKLRKEMMDMTAVPSIDDLDIKNDEKDTNESVFDEGDDDLFGDASGANNSAAPEVPKNAVISEPFLTPAPVLNKSEPAYEREVEDMQEPVPVVAAPAPKKKNLLSRIFAKPGAGRTTNLSDALAPAGTDSASQNFRYLVGSALKSYVQNSEAFESWGLDDVPADASEEKKTALLKGALGESGLSEQEAADAFAEVASAMLVQLTDESVEASKGKKGDETDKNTLAKLDALAEFVGGAGAVFSSTVPNAIIEPVQYNGKARKGLLEDLYLRYCKAGMSLEGLMASMGMGGGAQEGEEGADEAAKDAQTAAALSEQRVTGLPRLQQVFAIKEGKRSGLEQKAMRDMLANMAKGEGGMGDLGGMMEAMSKGGGMPGMEGMPDLSGMPGMEGMPEGMPDMSPEEMAAMSKDALKEVKASLQDGTVTRKDVEELEKIMGMDMKQLSGMINSGQVDKAKLAEMGPEFAEMLEVFKQLGDIK